MEDQETALTTGGEEKTPSSYTATPNTIIRQAVTTHKNAAGAEEESSELDSQDGG